MGRAAWFVAVSGPISRPPLPFSRSPLTLARNSAKRNTHRPSGRVTNLLILMAGGLIAGLVGSIAAETFDSDLDTCPFAGDVAIAGPTLLVASVQPGLACALLSQISSVVMLASAHVILQYRPRSALPFDSPSVFSILQHRPRSALGEQSPVCSRLNMAARRGWQVVPSLAAAISFAKKECKWGSAGTNDDGGRIAGFAMKYGCSE